MKLCFAVVLSVAISVCSFSAYAQTPSTTSKAAPPKAAPAMKKIKVARWLPQPICADVGQALPLAPGIRE
jgi:hypothetical protein